MLSVEKSTLPTVRTPRPLVKSSCRVNCPFFGAVFSQPRFYRLDMFALAFLCPIALEPSARCVHHDSFRIPGWIHGLQCLVLRNSNITNKHDATSSLSGPSSNQSAVRMSHNDPCKALFLRHETIPPTGKAMRNEKGYLAEHSARRTRASSLNSNVPTTEKGLSSFSLPTFL